MTAPDPAVVEAAARAWFAHANDIAPEFTYDDLGDEDREALTTPVRWILTAAMPLLREQIAREVEADARCDDTWHATCDDYRAAGWDGDPDDYERMFWESGQNRAARIIRGAS